jgi:2-octaprenyl-6-methoxyphenol hydroxylase
MLDKRSAVRDSAAMARDESFDLLILGGGLIGLTLARALVRAGLGVALIERRELETTVEDAYDGRASAIAAASARILEGIGVWPAMADEAEAILEIRVVDGDAPLFLHYDHRDLGEGPLGHIVENRVTRKALLAALAGQANLTVFAPASLEVLERGALGVSARLADGREIRARLAVAADGRRSETRAQAGIETVEWRYRQSAIVCTVAHERPHRGIAIERFLPVGPFAILPMTGNRSSLVWTESEDRAPEILALDDDGFAAEMRARFGDFLGALRVVGPRWSYPLGLSNAKRYIAPRLALVGDAAHAIHPLAGQGFNLGLRGVASLAEVLVDAHRLGLDIGATDRLERYERWRRFDAFTLAAVTDGLNRLFSNDIAPVKLTRDLGLAAVNRMPPLKRLFMRHAMGLLGQTPRLARGEPL